MLAFFLVIEAPFKARRENFGGSAAFTLLLEAPRAHDSKLRPFKFRVFQSNLTLQRLCDGRIDFSNVFVIQTIS